MDSGGNTYITGYFQTTAVFGTTTLTSAGSLDVFVAKLDANGNFLWATRAGGTNTDYVQGIAVDSGGNYYVTGSFQTTVVFGTTTLTSAGGYDIFVTKNLP